MSSLNGWHPGERLVHKKIGFPHDPYMLSPLDIDGELPPEHAKFHTTRLPFVPVVTLDSSGRPWGSILAGSDGKPGFIRTPRYTVLSINAKLWPGEPLLENAKAFDPKKGMLAAGIGIEFSTRRRNKFAGKVTKLSREDDHVINLDLTVDEAIGNCPKYINVRDLVPHTNTSPAISDHRSHMSPDDRLPNKIISFIQDADTVFIGTTYEAPEKEARLYPSHLGMNQRGGRKGFIRVVPSDRRTIVLPDFSGNRLMTSLGNIEATPLASLTFVSFTTGDILYVTGNAQNLFGRDAQKLMPLQDRLTTVQATGYILVEDALPVRQRPGTDPKPSPYSPPIRFLAEEAPQSKLFDDADRPYAVLTSIDVHSPSIATFSWEASKDVQLAPGQAVVMDFSPLLGARRYQHMSPLKPSSVNDDFIRTWTVSKIAGPRAFSLTMREKPGGTVTGGLFSIARKLAEVKPLILEDSRPLNLSVYVVGVTGDFTLPSPDPSPDPNTDSNPNPPPKADADTLTNDDLGLLVPQMSLSPPPEPKPPTPAPTKKKQKTLWVAGGIGITPFLAMLRGLAGACDEWSVNLVLSTREPEVLLPMLEAALPRELRGEGPSRVVVDVFSEKPVPAGSLGADKGEGEDKDAGKGRSVTVRAHTGRVTPQFFGGLEWRGAEGEESVYVCGPAGFEAAVVQALVGLGVDRGAIHREEFTY